MIYLTYWQGGKLYRIYLHADDRMGKDAIEGFLCEVVGPVKIDFMKQMEIFDPLPARITVVAGPTAMTTFKAGISMAPEEG